MKIGIITPVGPGHDASYTECKESISTAWATGSGAFTALEIIDMPDPQGVYGRSARRNEGIARAQSLGCDWIFFLDADDLIGEQAFIEVSPYLEDYDAIWGNICEMNIGDPASVKLRDRQIEATNDIDDILLTDPYLTLQMGHFVRTGCAGSVGFDEGLNAGEDFKYYLEICRRYKFAKVPHIFFINRRGNHSSGPKSATGADWREATQQVIKDYLRAHETTKKLTLDNKTSIFQINNPFDIIQAHHCKGVFFEQSELQQIAKSVGNKKVIAEIGANIGNHTVFYAHHMRAKKIFPFEPNPDATSLLQKNIKLNRISRMVDSRGIGIGLGATASTASIANEKSDNLGAAHLTEGETIKVYALDYLLGSTHIDFIKIDVEGMEFDVLKGAKKVIAKNRPKIYIEVWNDSIPKLTSWIDKNGYQVLWEARLVNAINFFIAPK